MFSKVADELRRQRRTSERALAPLERLRRAQRLGDDAAAAYASAHGVSVAEAVLELSRLRRAGRRPSRCTAPAE